MGFGKLIKDVARGINELNDDRRERKQQEKLRNYQRSEDIAAGKFCKGCGKTGDFHNQCGECLQDPFCNGCCLTNKRFGTLCLHCCPKFMCQVENCYALSDVDCVACNRQVCQKHWGVLFVQKNQFFTCVYDKGNVCTTCAESNKSGLFTKHFNCPKCGNELYQKTIR